MQTAVNSRIATEQGSDFFESTNETSEVGTGVLTARHQRAALTCRSSTDQTSFSGETVGAAVRRKRGSPCEVDIYCLCQDDNTTPSASIILLLITPYTAHRCRTADRSGFAPCRVVDVGQLSLKGTFRVLSLLPRGYSRTQRTFYASRRSVGIACSTAKHCSGRFSHAVRPLSARAAAEFDLSPILFRP